MVIYSQGVKLGKTVRKSVDKWNTLEYNKNMMKESEKKVAKITFIFPNFRTVITTEKEFKELREILNKEVAK